MGQKTRARKGTKDQPRRDTHPLRPSPNWPLLALSLIGIALTGYLSWTGWIGGSLQGCAVGSSCDVVLSSRWATFLGLPTALWGLLAYLTLAGAAFIRRADTHWRLAWTVAFFGLLYSAYLTAISLTILRAACPYCLTSLALMASSFALVTYQRPSTLGNFSWRRWLSKAVPVAAALIVALHLNYTAAPNEYTDAPDETSQAEDPTVRALAIHLAESGARMYGAHWCPHCQDQKRLFGASAERLPYIECSPGPRGTPPSARCQAAQIRSYPTWDIAGRRFEEVLTLEQLARATGFQPPVGSQD